MYYVYAPGNGQPVKAETREEAAEIATRHAQRIKGQEALILEEIGRAVEEPTVTITWHDRPQVVIGDTERGG